MQIDIDSVLSRHILLLCKAQGQKPDLRIVSPIPPPTSVQRPLERVADPSQCPRVRNPDQFNTYLLLSSSARTPLLTLWTTNWCPTCKVVGPLLQSLVESGVGEAEGGVGYCTVEFDAPDVMAGALGLTYMINSVPTLLSFDAGEAQVATKLADGNRLKDRRFLEEWIRTEARRHGGRGGGGPGGGAAFGGLFSGWKR